MINIALFKPDIPQNTAAIIRLCACFKVKVHIIEPCGFNMEDARFKRVVMDYKKLTKIQKYKDFDSFIKKNSNSRIILITTKAKKITTNLILKLTICYYLEEKVLGLPRKFIIVSSIN